jgi:hypothetical protein
MRKITIGSKEIEADEEVLNQADLDFYEENPRIYSQILNFEGGCAIQTEIENALTRMEHVKQLQNSIEQNGGLIDPVLVIKRNGRYTVLEGNSRLAAYRILAEKDLAKWKTIKCLILPDSISENDIFTLLGQYHLIGRKDWNAFERAAYIFRKKETSGFDSDILAKNIGLTHGDVKHALKVYQFMKDHDDLRADRWSYYDEYLKNQGIKKYRETISHQLDPIFVSQVKSGEIKEARVVRDKLGAIAKATDKVAQKFIQKIINKDLSVEEAYEHFEATGKTGNAYTKIKKFRQLIVEEEFQKKVKNEAHSTPNMVAEMDFELKKIKTAIEKLQKDVTGK